MRYLVRKMLEASNMKEGNPYRLLLTFMLPLLIGNIFQQLYNIIDSIIVGRYVGRSALAAVGSSFQVNFLILALFVGFGIGAMIIVAQLYGKADFESLRRLLHSAYRIIIFAAIPLALIGVFFAKPILTMMQVHHSQEALEQATIYLQIVSIGILGQLGFNVNAGFLQGMGDSISSLVFLIIATIINVVLDIFLTIVIPLGVVGVALATVIAQTFSWIFGIFYINRVYKELHINILHLSFDKDLVFRAMKLGLPSSIQQILYALGSLFITGLINIQGEAFMAGYTAGIKLDTFVFLPIISMSMALTTFTGQNIVDGAGKRLKKGINAALILTSCIAIFLGLSVYFLRYEFMTIFTTDQSVIDTGVIFLEQTMPFYLPLSILYIFNAVFQGSGNTFMPMVSSVLAQVVFRLPLALILMAFSPKILYYCFPLSWLMGAVIVAVYYYTGLWRRKINVVS